MVEENFFNQVIIQLDHYQQKATWDCGISCVLMVLASSTRTVFLDHFVEICEEEGFDKSTWSIDLAYLLLRFGVKHLYCTITLGVDPTLSSEGFYRSVLSKDYQRIFERFQAAKSRGVHTEKRSVTIYEIISHLNGSGPLIVLVNANLLVCDKCLQRGFALRTCLPCSPTSYQGHYIVVVGYNYPSSIIFYRNPSFTDRICSMAISAFDKARQSFGTDEDIIFIYMEDIQMKEIVLVISILAANVFCQETTDAKPEPTVPAIPAALLESQYDLEVSNLVFVWQNRISREASDASRTLGRSSSSKGPSPKTIIAVEPSLMSNLIPQDAPHPLFHDKYAKLTDEFILDSLSTDIADITKFETPEGTVIKTISGKELLFKKSPTDEITINDVGIKTVHQTLGEDPVTVFVINDFLFNHRNDVQEAFKVLSKETKGRGTDFLG